MSDQVILKALIELAAAYRRGSVSSDPNDSQYDRTHRLAAGTPSGQIQGLVGTHRADRGGRLLNQPVNVRAAADGYYVDTPVYPAVGPGAGVARGALMRHGVQPCVVPLSAAIPVPGRPGVLRIAIPESSGGGYVVTHPQLPLGRPKDLPARQQVKTLWTLLRG